MCVCVCACVRACMRACVRACVCAWVFYVHLVCYPITHVWLRDDGIDIETREGGGCENNWIRRIVGVRRRMEELRVEVGVKESFKNKLARSRLKWVGHGERMGDEILAIKDQKVKGKRWQGRLRIRWENCVKRDLERVGGERRTTAKDRRSWRLDGELGERSKRRRRKR